VSVIEEEEIDDQGTTVKKKGEGGVDNRAGEGKERTAIAVATKGTIAVADGETTLNSLIT